MLTREAVLSRPESTSLKDLQAPIGLSPRHPAALLNSSRQGHLVEIVHAATLFSEGSVTTEGALVPALAHYLAKAGKSGITAVYAPGIYRTSMFSELAMPHFASTWQEPPQDLRQVKASVFAIADLIPNGSIKSWENLRRVAEQALRCYGITLVVDFVPNTIAVDSEAVRNRPDLIADSSVNRADLERCRHWEDLGNGNRRCKYWNRSETALDGDRQKHLLMIYSAGGPSELFVYTRESGRDGVFKIYVQRESEHVFRPHFWVVKDDGSGEVTYCKTLGSDTGTGKVWADVAQLKTWDQKVREWQADLLVNLGNCVPIVRADMAHLPPHDYWSAVQTLARGRTDKTPVIWGEAYQEQQGRLAKDGLLTYADWIRNWINTGNIPALMRDIARSEPCEFMKRNSIAYVANHDDAGSANNLLEGAKLAILTALPVPVVLLPQGARFGDHRRYGADQHVPLLDFRAIAAAERKKDPAFVDFVEKILPLGGLDVFRSPASDCRPATLEPRGGKSSEQIFHVVRTLGEDRVLAVVDYQLHTRNSSIEVNLAASFKLAPEKLAQLNLVNLITGRIQPAEERLVLRPQDENLGYNVYLFALAAK